MRGLSVAAWLLLGVLAGTARGDAYAEGRLHFKRGHDAYALKHYDAALQEFRAAYDLAPFPVLLYDIARCQEELGDTAAAIVTYERYVAVAPLGVADSKAVREHIVKLRGSLLDWQPPATGSSQSGPGESERTLLRPRAFDEPAEAAPSASAAPLVAASAVPAPVPVYRRWWVWASAGLVLAVGVGIGLGVGLSGSSPQPLTFPALRAGAP